VTMIVVPLGKIKECGLEGFFIRRMKKMVSFLSDLAKVPSFYYLSSSLQSARIDRRVPDVGGGAAPSVRWRATAS
jgi:hypothetical protein